MTIAHMFDPQTRVFTGTKTCQTSQSGAPLVPQNALLTSPPAEIPDGYCAVAGVSSWHVIPIVVPPEAVKTEAYQRIIAILPEWKQRNLTARAAVLAEKGRDNWSSDELAEWDAGMALWGQISAIRDASNALEAMTPIPLSFADDEWWLL